MDLVRIFEKASLDSDFLFFYGNKSHLNLIDNISALQKDKVHVLLFPIKRGMLDRNKNARKINGSFFFVKLDEFANAYYNEVNSDNFESKYESKIEPLSVALNLFETKLHSCSDISIKKFDSTDAVDVIDANLTGLFVEFEFEVYE